MGLGLGVNGQGLVGPVTLQGYLPCKKTHTLGHYRIPIPRVPGVSQGGGRFLMGEVPLYEHRSTLPAVWDLIFEKPLYGKT